MKLVIAEKLSVGQSIAKVLGAAEQQRGYIEGNGYIVTWCVGHLVGLADASVYDERYHNWQYDTAPHDNVYSGADTDSYTCADTNSYTYSRARI